MNKRIKKKIAIRKNPFLYYECFLDGSKYQGIRHRARNTAMVRNAITVDKCNLIPIEVCKKKMCEEFSEDVFRKVYNKMIEYIHYFISVKRDAIRELGPIFGIRQFDRCCQYYTFPVVVSDNMSLRVRVRVKYDLKRFTFKITNMRYSVL